MSAREGADIGDVLRRMGPQVLLDELEAAGLSVAMNRCRCPFDGCADKGRAGRRNLHIYTAGKPHVYCFACEAGGDLIDVLQVTRGMSKEEATEHVMGAPASSRPPLQVVRPPPAAVEDDGKLKPEEVRRLWKGMLLEDEECDRYLGTRGLGQAVELGLVRYASSSHPDKRVSAHAKREYRLAFLLRDVVGEERGIQIRLARKAKAGEEPYMSVRGSAPGKSFYGSPHLIEASPIVCVTEGGADTVAVATWTTGHRGVCVVGAAGKNNLHKLAEDLERSGIDVTGKLFLLHTQNDRPANKSRRSFERLRQALVARGARAVHVRLHDEYKDVADWLQENPDADWPPEDVREQFLAMARDGEEEPSQDTSAASPHAAVMPKADAPDKWAQDLNTLCALLEDDGHRESILGRSGPLEQSELTHEVLVGGKPVQEADLTIIRRRIEIYARATDSGKPLKFDEGEIARALQAVARENLVHPVRQWLSGLNWDGTTRLGQLGPLMGHEHGTIETMMLARWMIAAVARAMEPGCKVDTALVLVGAQSARKTSFLEVLGGDWYSGEAVTPGVKDDKQIMGGAWIIEWGELASIRKNSVESVKHFLSQRVDQYRPPYGRRPIKAPRGCVFAGTSNEDSYLSDPTGNRRFWTVRVKQEIDLAWVRENREQLFAEALDIFNGGASCPACRPHFPAERCPDHRWWLTREEEEELAAVNVEFEVQDVWTDPVRDWLSNRLDVGVTTAQVLHEALGKEVQHHQRADEMRIAGVLKQLGWQLTRQRGAGGGRRRVYVRP